MKDGHVSQAKDFKAGGILFDFNERYWTNIMEFLNSYDYVDGIGARIIPGIPDVHVRLKEHLKITHRGIEYLGDNRMMQKVKKFYGAA